MPSTKQHKIWFAFAVIWMLFSITFNLEIIIRNRELGDFGSFIAAGINTRDGKNPYDNSSPLIFEARFPRFGVGGKQPNLNPPISLLIFELLAESEPFRTLIVWRAASVLIYAIAILLLANEYKPGLLPIVWCFALAGFWHTIGLGQIYMPLLLLSTLTWLDLRHKKEIRAGIFLGLLVSIKPNFIAWIFLLALSRQWKTVLSALVVLVICAVTPLIWLPPGVYLQWLEASRVGIAVLSMPGNSSLMGLTSRIGNPDIGLVLSIALAALTGWLVFRARTGQANSESVSSAGIFLSLLISPITWAGYTILSIPYFLSRKQWSMADIVAAAILTLPFNFAMHFYYNFGQIAFVFWGWWYGIALAICVIRVVVKLRRGFALPHIALSQTPQ